MAPQLTQRQIVLALLSSAAFTGFSAQAMAQSAQEPVEISEDTTTPVLTSTAGENDTPADVTVTDEGGITLESGTAITIDSDNDVIMNGSILFPDETSDTSIDEANRRTPQDGSTGVFVTGDVTFSYTQSGSIILEQEAIDPDPDDFAEPVIDFADNRYGFHLDTGDYVGNITFGTITEDGATNRPVITVRGDNSAAVAIDGNLDGNIISDGAFNIGGQNSTGLRLTGNVSGDVNLRSGSSLNVIGENTTAFSSAGMIGGSFRSVANVDVTAFQDTTPDADLSSTEDVDESADNIVQAALVSGHGFVFGGDVSGGILFDGALPSGFTYAENLDTTTDPDTGEEVLDTSNDITFTGASSVTVLGSGNSLRLDGGAMGMTVGLVDTSNIVADPDDDNAPTTPYDGDYGIINRGNLRTFGVYGDIFGEDADGNIDRTNLLSEGVEATSVYIANATIAGGFRNDGDIGAFASNADATAFLVGENTTLPHLLNNNRIQAGVTGSGGDVGGEAVAIQIDSSASVSSITNNAFILTEVTSDDSNAYGIRDMSGTVTSFTNTGVVQVNRRDDTSLENDENAAEPLVVAADFSANTAGVDILSTVQDDFDPDTSNRAGFGIIIGDVLTGSGNDSYTSDAGSLFGDLTMNAGNDTVDLSLGTGILGNVDFGTGNNTLLADDATIEGALTFGTGSSSITLNNGSTVTGDIASTGNLDIAVSGSTLNFGSNSNLNLDNFTVANNGDTASALGFTVSADGTQISQINANTASIAAGTGISTLFDGAFTQNEISATIISANALTLDGGVSSLILDDQAISPVLFTQTLSEGASTNEIVLTLSRKSSEELGLGRGLSGALDPIISNFAANDQELGQALFNATSLDDFTALFSQVVAGPLDAPMAYSRAQNNSVTSLVSQRVDFITSGDEKLNRRFWLQEEGYFLNRDSDSGSNGFDGGGFVIAGGFDTPVGPIEAVGLSIHYASARYDEQLGEDFPFDRTTTGIDFYYADRIGKMEFDARLGYAISNNTSERNVDFGTGTRLVTGEWDGSQFTANSRVRYRHSMGKTEILPFISTDFIALREDAYTEEGDATLALGVADREADSLRANVGVEISRLMETGRRQYEYSVPGTFRPRLTLAWSQEFLTDDYAATYCFENSGCDTSNIESDPNRFTLYSEPESGAAIIGTDVTYENEYATVHLGASGTFGEQTEVFTLRAGIGLKW